MMNRLLMSTAMLALIASPAMAATKSHPHRTAKHKVVKKAASGDATTTTTTKTVKAAK